MNKVPSHSSAELTFGSHAVYHPKIKPVKNNNISLYPPGLTLLHISRYHSYISGTHQWAVITVGDM
jgi:hypothetical protein